MYNCPICNQPFELGTKFCSGCGCNLEETFIENPICPTCHRKFPAGSIYCTEDGTKLVSPDKLIPKCIICGTTYSADTKFCPKDGGAVIPEAIRHATLPSLKAKNTAYAKANLGNRFVAYILDGLICMGLSIPALIFYAIGMSRATTNYYDVTDYSHSVIFFLLAILEYLIPLGYTLIKDGIGEGQSLGKRIMHIKVIKIADSSKCTMGTSVLRNLVGNFISCLPIIGWLIEPIMVLATSDRRRIADRVAGTMVVNKN